MDGIIAPEQFKWLWRTITTSLGSKEYVKHRQREASSMSNQWISRSYCLDSEDATVEDEQNTSEASTARPFHRCLQLSNIGGPAESAISCRALNLQNTP